MENTMQINYWTIGGFEFEKAPEVALEEAKAMGYDGVELCFGAGELAPEVTETRCREIASAAESMGMKIGSLASGNYWQQPLTHPDSRIGWGPAWPSSCRARSLCRGTTRSPWSPTPRRGSARPRPWKSWP